MTPAYELLCETYRLGEGEFDCRIQREPRARSVSWCGKSPPDMDSVTVIGSSSRLASSDFPANQLAWPIMSRALWAALGRPGIPFRVSVREAMDGPEVLADRFVAFYLRPTAGLFDPATSSWAEDSSFPGEVGLITRLRFRTGVALPSVFRLAEAPGRLFVSRRRRIRLLDYQAVGGRFVPVGAP